MNIDALKTLLAAKRESLSAKSDPTYQVDSEAIELLDMLDAFLSVLESLDERIKSIEANQ